MKQAMRPAQRGIMALFATGIVALVEAGSGSGCPDPVQLQTTPRCVNRRLRRWARAMATASRRSAAFRARDGWRRKGVGPLEEPGLLHRAAWLWECGNNKTP